MKVSIEEITGVDVKEIYTGTELVYLKELDRYLYEMTGQRLEVGGIPIDPRVVEGEHFSYVTDTTDLDWCYEETGKEKANYIQTARKYFEEDLSGVVYAEKNDDRWVYSYHTDKTANMVLNGYNRSMGYVSLQAYMTILYYMEGKQVPMLRLVNHSHKQEEMEYVDILILKQYGNRLLQGKVEIQYSASTVVQPEWEAYVLYRRQLGYMLEQTDKNTKKEYMEANYKPGDVVLYYTTEKPVKTKTIRRLKSCYPAVITKMTTKGITLAYYSLIETKLTRRKRLNAIEEEEGVTYDRADYENYPKTIAQLDYSEAGMCDYTYTEDKFVLEVIEGRETVEMYIETEEGLERYVNMGTRDTVYAVFEDRGVRYNKKRYLDKYFEGREPKYDVIRRGGSN